MNLDQNPDDARGTDEVVRLADVAREAGVAIATASRALSNPDRVNAKTRARVLSAAGRLGYTSNIAARSLRSGLSRMVLVIMPSWEAQNVITPALRGVDAELMRAGYSMIVSALAKDRSADPRLIEMARGGFVDGILAVTNDPPRTGGLPILSARLPSVGLLIDLSPFGVPSVVVAEREGTRLLTERIIARGRRRLMFVGGLPGYHDVERLAGFEDAVRAAPHPIDTVRIGGDFSTAAGLQAADSFFAMADRPDGAIFTNDQMAVAFMDAVRAKDIRIPEDISVVGFDDIDSASYCQPPLTTYRQPMELMGAEATRMLLRLINGETMPKAGRTMFPGDIMLRGSI